MPTYVLKNWIIYYTWRPNASFDTQTVPLKVRAATASQALVIAKGQCLQNENVNPGVFATPVEDTNQSWGRI